MESIIALHYGQIASMESITLHYGQTASMESITLHYGQTASMESITLHYGQIASTLHVELLIYKMELKRKCVIAEMCRAGHSGSDII